MLDSRNMTFNLHLIISESISNIIGNVVIINFGIRVKHDIRDILLTGGHEFQRKRKLGQRGI